MNFKQVIQSMIDDEAKRDQLWKSKEDREIELKGLIKSKKNEIDKISYAALVENNLEKKSLYDTAKRELTALETELTEVTNVLEAIENFQGDNTYSERAKQACDLLKIEAQNDSEALQALVDSYSDLKNQVKLKANEIKTKYWAIYYKYEELSKISKYLKGEYVGQSEQDFKRNMEAPFYHYKDFFKVGYITPKNCRFDELRKIIDGLN